MTRLRGVLAASCIVAATASSAVAAPIIGGTATKVGDFPSVVAIEVGEGGLCTGILITKDWVITASHCMDPSVVGEASQDAVTASVTVYFNTINVFVEHGTQIKAKETFHDTRFDSDQQAHDVGLVHLATPVTDITPSLINFDASKSPVGISVLMVGFGTTMTGTNPTTAGVEYEVGNQKSISCASQGLSDADLLCYSQTDGQGKCEGDSGGPSFLTIDGVQTVVGLTSFGDQSCTVFGADTRTEADLDFILQHVPGLDCTSDAECGSAGSDSVCFARTCMVPPFAPAGIGTSCKGDSDCDSAICDVGPGKEQLCAISCAPGSAASCPDDFECLAAGSDGGACWPTGSSSGGCCDAGNGGAPAMVLGIGLIGLVLRRRRR